MHGSRLGGLKLDVSLKLSKNVGDVPALAATWITGTHTLLLARVNGWFEIEVVRCALSDVTSEAVVNAANAQLEHGGGIARAIALEAGAAWNAASHASGLASPLIVGTARTGTDNRLSVCGLKPTFFFCVYS